MDKEYLSSVTLHRVKYFLQNKVFNPLLGFLKQGTSPHKLAISVAVGFILGLFPILGVTTPIGFLLAFVFKLNAAALQLVNYLLYPIQIALIIPLINIGIWIFSHQGIELNVSQLISYIQSDFWGTLYELWEVYLLGALAWVILVVPIGPVVFIVSKTIFQKIKDQSDKKTNVPAAGLKDL